MGRIRLAGAWLALSLFLGACAPSVPISQSKVEISGREAAARRIRLLEPAAIKLDTGYSRTLVQDSVWLSFGRLPQGQVFRPVGTIFTIEGRQVHEAYLVIEEQKLVGFYLPGEENYSPLSTAVPLKFGDIK
ncbi:MULTISPECIES: hypothetical protein [Cupriavidus]